MRLFFVFLLPALLIGCAAGPALDPVDPPASLVELEPELRVNRIWSRQVGVGVDGRYLRLAPLAVGGTVYAADSEGTVAAVDAETGKLAWEVELERPLGTGAADAGNVIVLGGDAEVIALAKEDGAVVWRAEVTSEVLAEPVYGQGVVVVHSVDGRVFGLDVTDGSRRWVYGQDVSLLSLRGASAPKLVAGGALVGFANGKVAALSLREGNPLWEATVAVPSGRTELERMVDVDGRLVVANGAVFAVAFQGRLAAIELRNGQVAWERDFSSYTGLAGAGQYLYLTDAHGDLWALAQRNGATMWKQDAVHGRLPSTPVTMGEAVVVGDYEGYLHWFSLEDGRALGRAHLGGRDANDAAEADAESATVSGGDAVMAPPAVDGDRIFALNQDGELVAFEVVRAE